MEDHARALADGIEAALPGWVVRSVKARLPDADEAVVRAAEDAGARAATEVGAVVRRLLALDIDEQRTTPLTLVRGAVRYPAEVLRAAGVPPVERDPFSQEHFPDDDYDLTPATFADVDPSLADVGLAWGAAKAWEHKRRHRP
ncbi:MAG TPA: hypothetical protein VGB03_08530 [Acidimicrobiales bacterium]